MVIINDRIHLLECRFKCCWSSPIKLQMENLIQEYSRIVFHVKHLCCPGGILIKLIVSSNGQSTSLYPFISKAVHVRASIDTCLSRQPSMFNFSKENWTLLNKIRQCAVCNYIQLHEVIAKEQSSAHSDHCQPYL